MSAFPRALRDLFASLAYAALGPRAVHRLTHPAPRATDLPRSQDVVTDFHVLTYTSGIFDEARWLGVPILKSPLDCWVYQEMICELRPDLIVETGTYLGGSALFFASICDLLQHGRVLTIDVQRRVRRTHPRITALVGDSTSEEILRAVRAAAAGAERVMVVLDSDHRAAHVAKELRAYREFVSVGSYLVVEDTNVNGHPVQPEHGPGPMEAVHEFLSEDGDFLVDRSREKFLLTYFPNGFLKRIRRSAAAGATT